MMNHLVTNYSLENHVIYLIKNFRVLSIEDYIYIYAILLCLHVINYSEFF